MKTSEQRSPHRNKLLFKHYRSVILNIIRNQGPISRSEIQDITKIRLTTITDIVRDLIDNNLVTETGTSPSSIGRHPQILKINPSGGYVIGVDIGASKIVVILTDLTSQIISHAIKELSIDEDRDEIISDIKSLIHKTITPLSISADKILGIGITTAGMIDAQNGVSIFAANIKNWHNVPIANILKSEFKVPVAMESCSSCMILAERWFGAGKKSENFILLDMGYGIGLGIIIQGQLYRGYSGSPGELGHIIVDPLGTKCSCGNIGCLETVASGKAIRTQAIEAIKNGTSTLLTQIMSHNNFQKLNSEMVFHAAQQGDSYSKELLNRAGQYLGIAITNVLNLFNPELVIAAGGLTKAGEFILKSMEANFRSKALVSKRPDSPIQFVVSKLGDTATALGATTLILKKIFSITELRAPSYITKLP